MRKAIAADSLRPSSMTVSSWRFIGDNPGVDCWTAWSGHDVTFLLIPVEEGRVYGYAARTRGGDTGSDRSWLAPAAEGSPEPGAAVAQALEGALVLAAQCLPRTPHLSVTLPVPSGDPSAGRATPGS